MINLPRRTDHRDAISLAAAVTDLQITWVAGVSGYDAHRLALPSTGATTVLKEGAIGNWRAHMDTLQWYESVACSLRREADRPSGLWQTKFVLH